MVEPSMIAVNVPPHSTPTDYLDPPSPLAGYWWETEIVSVPYIEGVGHPREFLHWLRELESKGKPVFFPTVINHRLDTLLRKRGYVDAATWADEFNEWCFGLLRGEPS